MGKVEINIFFCLDKYIWIFIFQLVCELSSSLGFVFIISKLFYLVGWQATLSVNFLKKLNPKIFSETIREIKLILSIDVDDFSLYLFFFSNEKSGCYGSFKLSLTYNGKIGTCHLLFLCCGYFYKSFTKMFLGLFQSCRFCSNH